MKKEVYFLATPIIHEAVDNSPGKLSGYAVKFNQVSADRGGYKDRFASTAFANLQNDGSNIFALLDHSDDPLHRLARTDNGSLTLNQDDVGVRFTFSLPDTNAGRDVANLVRDKMLNGMSFGYVPDQYSWNSDKANPIRTHESGKMTEISVVYNPAFQNTSVELHSLDEPNPALLEEFKKANEPVKLNLAKLQLELLKIKSNL